MAVYRVNVVGESFHDRQAHISTIEPEMVAVLKREDDNPYGRSAVKVLVAERPIGYIGKEDNWVAELIDNRVPVSARVWKIKGRGADFLGVILEIRKGEDAEAGEFVRRGSYHDDEEVKKEARMKTARLYMFVTLAAVIGALIGFFT